MLKPTLNRPLLLLAGIGVALYVFITVLTAIQQTNEEGTEGNPSITKKEAADAALAFIGAKYKLASPKTFVVYETHKTLSGYLQQANVTDDYQKTYAKPFPIDYFQVKITDPSTHGHFEVDVNFDDKSILGWSMPITGSGKAIDADRAENMARQILADKGLNPSEFVRITKDDAPRYRIFLERKERSVGEAKLLLQVDVQERAVIGYSFTFSIPKEHQEWIKKQDHSASIMTWISLGSTTAMGIFALIYAIRFRKEISFSRGAALSIIYVLIYIINNINMYPAFKAMVGITDASVGTLFTLLFTNIITLLMGAALYFSLLSGNLMWRRYGWNPWTVWKEALFGRHVFNSMGRGYLICLFVLGVQRVLFYIAEHYFHVWSVNDPSDSPLNMLAPSLFPLLAWAAGISEEAAFRLLGIAIFKKLLKNNFLAILIPSILWAASHTQYPIYPVYTRLIEVTVIGIIFGYVFLKYGFITAMFAHASMDSILMGLSLVSLNQTSQMLLGIFYMLLPALIGCILGLLHRKWWRPPTPSASPFHPEAL